MNSFEELLRLLLLIAILSLISMSDGGRHEKRLLDHLFNQRQHSRLERPVADETQPLVVHFGLVLQQIIDVEEKNEIISTNLWLNLAWNDYSMGWNESEFGGIKTLRIPAALLWRPDILMYNSADEDIDSTFPTNVVLSSSGDCLWVPPGLFRSTCKMDITWFPFDDQMCSLKFGSWTYDSRGIDLRLQTTDGEGGGGGGGDLSSFIPNGEWMLIEMPVERNVKSYDCCPEEYIDVTFTIHIRRRTLYYGFNLIIPCVLISSMALLTFTLPPDAGEKISLGVTILLSLTVFLLLVAETMPPTSDAVPLIGMYFASIMLMCSLSVVFTVLVLNCHYRSPETHQMPTWVRKGICEWLATVLFVRKPEYGKTASRNRRHFRSRNTKSVGASKSRKLYSKSLDASEDLIVINNRSKTSINAKKQPRSSNNATTEVDAASATDNNRTTTPTQGSINETQMPDAAAAAAAASMSAERRRSRNRKEERLATGNKAPVTSAAKYMTFSLCDDDGGDGGDGDRKSPSSQDPWRPLKHHHVTPEAKTLMTSDECSLFLRHSVSLLTDIAEELRLLTDGIKADEEKEKECNEWKHAATVIDRLCLILFTCFTFISTVSILFSAPHTVV